MKLTTLDLAGRSTAARVDGEICVEIDGWSDVGSLLTQPNWRQIAAEARGSSHRVEEVRRGLLLPNPSKVLCIGLNYRSHIEEMGRDLPEYPTVFAKFADTLSGPDDVITAVVADPELDWEGELAVVIGATVYRADEEEAGKAIAGYTLANDISMRGWQYRTQEWLQGKIWARSTPVGPVLATPDEFDLATARLITTVNGEVMQAHAISDLLFTPRQLIAYLSSILPLRPGDLILTGTPGGVGRAQCPPRYLRPGDDVQVEVNQIGRLRNRVVREAPEHAARLRRI